MPGIAGAPIGTAAGPSLTLPTIGADRSLTCVTFFNRAPFVMSPKSAPCDTLATAPRSANVSSECDILCLRLSLACHSPASLLEACLFPYLAEEEVEELSVGVRSQYMCHMQFVQGDLRGGGGILVVYLALRCYVFNLFG